MSVFTDKTLTCRDCGARFTFTAGEQEFHASKGFANMPSRCPNCRAARKAERGGYSTGGGGYSIGERVSYSGGGFGGGYSTDRGRSRRQMYPATCAQCGRETEVPFQPTGIKPVYCSDCFQQQRSGYR